MQRIFSVTKAISSMCTLLPRNVNSLTCYFSTFQNTIPQNKLLQSVVPMVNPSCGMKIKGLVRRRCKSCYLVFRDERAYIMCKEHPRHKQMAMKAKPHNTWILTHASQSPVRPW